MSLKNQFFLLISLIFFNLIASNNSYSISIDKKYILTSCNPLTSNYLSTYYEDHPYEEVKTSILPTGEVELCSPYVLWRDDLLTNPSDFQIPLEIFSVQGVLDITLTVRKVRIDAHFFSYETRAFCYNDKCSVPGPTLHLSLGDRLKIKIVNELDKEDNKEVNLEQSLIDNKLHLKQKVFTNRINIFFPTLPFSIEDNSIYNAILPGESYQYDYVIPSNEYLQPGLHLYHSNVQGVSSLHFLGGLFGAIKLYPSINENFNYPLAFRSVTSMPFVFSHIHVDQSKKLINESSNKKYSNLDFDLKDNDNNDNVLSNEVYSLEEFNLKWTKSSLSYSFLSKFFQSDIQPNVIYNREKHQEIGLDIDNEGDRVTDIWLVNGQYQPKIDTNINTWFFYDFYVASADRILELELKNVVGMDDIYIDQKDEDLNDIKIKRCQMRLISKNGVYYTKIQEGPYVDHLILYQGERATVAARCVNEGIYYLQTIAHFENVLNSNVRNSTFQKVGDYQTKSTQVLATINATYTSVAQETFPTNLDFISVPSWMQNLSNEEKLEEDNFKFEEKELSLTKFDTKLFSFNRLSISTAFQKDFEELYPLCDMKFQENYINLPAITGIKMGMGTSCKMPCYDSVLCQSLYGTSQYNSTMFPSALKGACIFGSSLIDGISTVRDDCYESDEISTDENVKDLFPDTFKVQLSPFKINQTELLPSFISLSIYGHSDFLYPIYVQNHQLKLKRYTSVDNTISNILDKDHYKPLYNLPYPINLDIDRWNDMFIPVQGLLEFKLKLISSNIADLFSNNSVDLSKFSLLTPFLKFQDIGFIRLFDYIKVSDTVLDPNEVEPEYNPNLLDEYLSVETLITDNKEDELPDFSDLSTPLEFLNSDIAKVGKQCELNGDNYFYHESIDFRTKTRQIITTSCPNHYSKCQSSECGEKLKTRALIHHDLYKIPLYPTLRDSQTPNSILDLTCSNDKNKLENVNQILGGIALNGVGIYTPGNVNAKQNCIEYKYKDNYSTLRKEELKKVSEYKRQNSGRQYSLSADEIYQIEYEIKRKYELLEFSFASKGRTICNNTYHFYEGLLECGDELQRVANQIDICGGLAHRKSGRYAYHSLPVCLYKQLERDRNEKLKREYHDSNKVLRFPPHSVQIGWALDGFPIYGPRSIRGIRMYPCGHKLAHPTLCLDSCGGYEGKLPDVDDYVYRYYIPWESSRNNTLYLSNNDFDNDLPLDTCSDTIDGYGDCSRNSNKCCISHLPSINLFPYTLGCLRGCKYGEKNCEGNIERKGYVPSFFPKISHNLHNLYLIDPLPTVDEPMEVPTILPTAPVDPISFPFEEIEKRLKNKPRILTRVSNITYNSYIDLEKLKPKPLSLNLPDSFSYSLDITKDSEIKNNLIKKNVDELKYYYSYYDTMQHYKLGFSSVSIQLPLTNDDIPKLITNFNSFSTTMKNEAYITSMAYDKENNILYFSNEFEIYSYNFNNNNLEKLVNVIIKVDLLGYNFGLNKEEISLITVNNYKCHSIYYQDDQNLTCWITYIHSNLNLITLKSSEVEIYTKNGKIKGVSLDANQIFTEKSNKPVLRAVEFTVKPLRPFSLFFVSKSTENTNYFSPKLLEDEDFDTINNKDINRSVVSSVNTLYFTNNAEGSFSLHRLSLDSVHFETILEGLQKIVSVQIFKTIYNEDLSFKKLSNSIKSLPECYKYYNIKKSITSSSDLSGLTSTSSILYKDLDPFVSSSCASEGHYIILSDGLLEMTFGFPLWPIQDDILLTSSSLHKKSQWESTVFPSDSSIFKACKLNPTEDCLSSLIKSKLLIQNNLSSPISTLNPASISPFNTPQVNSLPYTSLSIDYNLKIKVFYHNFNKISSTYIDPVIGSIYSTSQDGVLIKFHMNSLFSSVASYPINVFELIKSSGSRNKLKINSLLPHNIIENKSPIMQLLHISNTESKFHSIFALPLSSSEKVLKPWIYHQIVLVDTNSEQLITLTDTGSFPISHDVFKKYGIFWPHQIILTTLENNSNKIRILLSEFLGKIWELQFEKLPNGSWKLDDNYTPHVIVQFEGGYPTQTLRSQLYQARYDGKRSKDLYQFEASN